MGHPETIERAAGRSGHLAWHLRDSSRLDPLRARPSLDFRGLLPRAETGVCVGIGLVTPLLSVQRCTTLLHTVARWQYVCAQRHAHWEATPQRCTGDAGRPGRPYLLADCPAHGVRYYGAVPPACCVDACCGGSAPLCHRRRRRDGCVRRLGAQQQRLRGARPAVAERGAGATRRRRGGKRGFGTPIRPI